jgi:type VI secretion system protein ImpA
MAIDIESLLSEVSVEAPCGEDLSYDASFLALEDMLRAKAGGGVVAGVEEEIEEPNWREIREKSSELLKRSKDLRLVTYLALSLLKMEGITGLRDGLVLMRGLLERYWDGLYPQLDPDDNNDPLERINILQSLSPGTVSEQDPIKFKKRLAEVPLCNSVQMGRFSLRDIQIAKAEITVSDGQKAKAPNISVIDAAFQDTTTDELLAISQATHEAIEHIGAVTGVFSERAAQGDSPNLSGFQGVLGSIHKCVQEYLAKRGQGEADDEVAPLAGTGVEQQKKSGISLSGDIKSVQEALLALDKVCQYYDRNEPSSPVPLLLRRAQRLVSKSFLDVIQDVCPDAVSRVQLICGTSGSDAGQSSSSSNSKDDGWSSS